MYFLCHTSCSTKEVAGWLQLKPTYIRKLRHSLGRRLGVQGGINEIRRLTALHTRHLLGEPG